jgi:hypothetical protein
LYHKLSHIRNKLAGLTALLLILILPGVFRAQCASVTPAYTLNLTSAATASATTPTTARNGTCCGGVDPCVKIVVLLNPQAMGLVLIAQGADPGGAISYEMNCSGVLIPVGTSVCVSGVNAATLTVCKIGNHPNNYVVTSIPQPSVPASLHVRVGCSQSVSATGFSTSTINWTAVNSGTNTSIYNGFLSCISGCSLTVITPTGSPPGYVDYEVSGYGQAPCNAVLFRDTVRVYFYSGLFASLNSTSACNGNTVILDPGVSGGKTPYTYSWSTGSTASSVTAGPGNYSVTIYDATGCPPIVNSITVSNYTSQIQVNAGSDFTVCANGSSVALSGSVVNASGGIWSGGNGTFTPSSTLLATGYIPTTSELTNGAQLYLTTTGNYGCPAKSDTVNLRFQSQPAINAGPNLTVCANNNVVSLQATITNYSLATPQWFSSGTGVFSSPAATATTYSPSAADNSAGSVNIVVTTTNNGVCAPAADTVQIIITPAPAPNAGLNSTICSTATHTLAGNINGPFGASWSSSGNGTFSSAGLNAVYTPGTSDINTGMVTLSLTSTNNGNCLAVVSTKTLTIDQQPTVAVAPSFTICSTANTVSLYGNVTGVTSSGQWAGNGSGLFSNSSSTTTTYSLSISDYVGGTVSFTLTSTNNGACAPAANTLSVTIVQSPVVSAGPNLNVCSTQSVAVLYGTVVSPSGTGFWASSGNGAFVPTSTNIAATYSISAADISSGLVTFTLSSTNNGPCASVSDTMMMRLSIQPTVTTSGNSTICAGDSAMIGAFGATSYSWSHGATTAITTVAPGITTIYTVQGINSVCIDTRTILLTVNIMPTVTASSSHSSVCAGQTMTLTAGGASSYTWLPMYINSTSVAVSPSAGNVYTLLGNNPQCPNDSVTVNLLVFPVPSVSLSATPTLVCEGDLVTLLANGASIYNWSNGGIGSSALVSVNSTATYSVTGTDINNCSATASIALFADKCLGTTDPALVSSAFVYPNPSRDALTVHSAVDDLFIISNIDGRITRTLCLTANQSAQISGLAEGIYLISNASGKFRKKIIVIN